METLLEELSKMSVGELVAEITFIIGVISVIIEKSKKLPFNPWTSLFKWMGDKITDSLKKQVNDFETQQTERMDKLEENQAACMTAIQESNQITQDAITSIRNDYVESIRIIKEDYNKRIDQLEYNADEKEVKRLRSNIICFSDACRQGNVRHTKQHFENIFRDYDDYLAYCKERNFQNHFIDGEMAYINSIYAEYSKENKFL